MRRRRRGGGEGDDYNFQADAQQVFLANALHLSVTNTSFQWPVVANLTLPLMQKGAFGFGEKMNQDRYSAEESIGLPGMS